MYHNLILQDMDCQSSGIVCLLHPQTQRTKWDRSIQQLNPGVRFAGQHNSSPCCGRNLIKSGWFPLLLSPLPPTHLAHLFKYKEHNAVGVYSWLVSWKSFRFDTSTLKCNQLVAFSAIYNYTFQAASSLSPEKQQ